MTEFEQTSGDASDALLQRVQAGDDDAVEPLLAALQPKLYRFSMAMCRHPEDAEDVLQESLLAVARNVRTLRASEALSTWLFTIARRFCIKKRRKSQFAPSAIDSLERLSEQERLPQAPEADRPDHQVERATTWKRVHEAIRNLDPERREVLVLRDIEGLRSQEVADVIGITVAAVKSRLHRARAELRDQLATKPVETKPDCPRIREVFSNFLEGDLSAEVCQQMQSHVSKCEICARECDGLKSALLACQTAPAEVPAAVVERIQNALRQGRAFSEHATAQARD